MKVTLGDKLGDQLDKFRLQFPSRPEEPKPQVGVVVPASGTGPDLEEKRRKFALVASSAAMDKIVSQVDESQVVGELLEWLFAKGYFKDSVIRSSLIVAQQLFFKERQ